MTEKQYKTMTGSGAAALAAGIVMIVCVQSVLPIVNCEDRLKTGHFKAVRHSTGTAEKVNKCI